MDIGDDDGRIRDLFELLHENDATDPEIVDAVFKNHCVFWSIQDDLVARSDAGAITARTYLANFNRAAMHMCAIDKTILGQVLFEKVFGEAAEHISDMIDPEALLADEQNSRNYG